MKRIKRLLLIIGLLLLSAVGYSQSQQVAHTPWIVENGGDWGSFQWQVLRQQVDRITFRYEVFVFSNSYLRTKSNGIHYDPALSFVKGVTVYMVEQNQYLIPYNQLQRHLSKVMCDHNSPVKIGEFYSNSPYNAFRITYISISPWDYNSNY